MKHGKKFNHLKRKSSHRAALLSNLSKSLILKKRIFTTLAKAKALRKHIEPILTKTKQDTTHSRRIIFSRFQDKVIVKELFGVVSTKIAERPGGYTRIIKVTQRRLNDGAEMCYIELVDFNEIFTKKKIKQKSKTRRGRKKDNKVVNVSEPTTQQKEDSKEVSNKNLEIHEKEKIDKVKQETEYKIEKNVVKEDEITKEKENKTVAENEVKKEKPTKENSTVSENKTKEPETPKKEEKE